MKLLLLVSLAAVLPAATAHHSIWTPSMYGVGTNWGYAAGNPVDPIGPGVAKQDDWWFRGPASRALRPAVGAVSTLVAGGKFTIEIACHIAWTSPGWRTTQEVSYLDACPGNVGSFHAGDPDGVIDESLVSGCATGIANVDSIEKVTWDNLAIFSVQSRCVRNRVTTFDVPAAMPKCTGSKCICAWFWLADSGSANFYMTGFECNVSGSSANARPISAPVDPGWCPRGSTTCFPTKGAKRPLYAYNSPSNVVWRGNDDRPGYHRNWGFLDGAQNDIFEPALVKTSGTSKVSSTATRSSSVTTKAATTSTRVWMAIRPVSTTTKASSTSPITRATTTTKPITSTARSSTSATETRSRSIWRAPTSSSALAKRAAPTSRYTREFVTSSSALDPEEGREKWVAARIAKPLALGGTED